MSETMLALLGFATIIMIIVLLLKNVTVPAIAFIGVSTVTALILVLTGTFTVKEMGGFIKAGVQGVHSTAALFIFSVLFFGIMTDVGMFDRIINALMKRVGHNVVGVALMTCIIAMIGHLDGGGASTFLITIPAMLPVYKRLKMRPTTLLLICVTAMGVMNLLPWGGPTMRTASVLEIESNVLWMKLMPMQIVGIGIALFTAVFWGFVEKKRGAGIDSGLAADDSGILEIAEEAGDHSDLVRPGMFWFNVCLTLFIIVCLIWLPVPSYYTFMLGCVIALLVDYPGARLQNKIIKSHAGPSLMMASTILAAGVFLGVLEDSPQEGSRHNRADEGGAVAAHHHGNADMYRVHAELVPHSNQHRQQPVEIRVRTEHQCKRHGQHSDDKRQEPAHGLRYEGRQHICHMVHDFERLCDGRYTGPCNGGRAIELYTGPCNGGRTIKQETGSGAYIL